MKTQWAQKQWLHNSSILTVHTSFTWTNLTMPCPTWYGKLSNVKSFCAYIITTSCKWNQKYIWVKWNSIQFNFCSPQSSSCVLSNFCLNSQKNTLQTLECSTLAHHNYMDLNANQNSQEISSNATPNKHRIELTMH
jgi:hypothetical protein